MLRQTKLKKRSRDEGQSASVVEWRRWGAVDPLYGVASWDAKQMGGGSPWTDEEFYALGKSDWEDFESLWRRYGLVPGVCVEIGCGTGRITRQLVQIFHRVEAVDVSEEMITYAQERIGDPRITFHLTPGLVLPMKDASVDAVFSTHVFQHLNSLQESQAYFAEVSRVMRSGATLMIHLPVHEWPSMRKMFSSLYKVIKVAGDVRAAARRRLMEINRAKPCMRGLSYPVGFLFEALSGHGLVSIELTVIRVRSNNGVHPFLFARKP